MNNHETKTIHERKSARKTMRKLGIEHIALVTVGIVLLAGCSGITDSSTGGPSTVSESTTTWDKTPTNSSGNNGEEINSSSISARERMYLNSTRSFGDHFRNGVSYHNNTEFVSSEANSNNSVVITIRSDGAVPLKQTIMDGVQSIGEVIIYTTEDEDEISGKINGTLKGALQPDSITVNVEGPDGEYLGSYDVDPEMVREYRTYHLRAKTLAQHIIDSYNGRKGPEFGSKKASDYLNNSEFRLWSMDYEREIKKSSYRNQLNNNISTRKIYFQSSDNSALHEFTWDPDEYSQYFGSATATGFGSYWRSSRDSYAMPPRRLYLYVHLPENDKDYVGYMNRTMVRWFLTTTDRGNRARNLYLGEEKFWFVEKDANPFSGFTRVGTNTYRRTNSTGKSTGKPDHGSGNLSK